MDLSLNFEFESFLLNQAALVSAVLAWLFTLYQLAFNFRRTETLFVVPFAFLLGASLFTAFCHTSGLLEHMPSLSFTFIPLYYALIPLEVAYFTALLGFPVRVSFRQLWHFIPVIVSSAVLWPLFSLPGAEKIDIWNQWFSYRGSHFDFTHSSLNLTFGAADILNNIYLWVLFLKTLFLYKNGRLEVKELTFILHLCLGLILLLKLVSMAAVLVNSMNLYLYTVGAITVFIIPFFMAGLRYPKLLHIELVKSSDYKPYRDNDTDENLHEVAAGIRRIVEEEKAYLDEDLTMPSLAHELGVSSRLISMALNKVIKKNFNQYINRFRVEEARKLLIEDYDRKVLSVAFAAGFNSKSVFYDAFQKATGLSPMQYRKKHGETRP